MTTTRPDTRRSTALPRFDRAERLLHWVNASLFAILLSTAAWLYIGQVQVLFPVGRELVRRLHVWSGLALPLPILATLLGPWRRGFRADVRRLNRWNADDRRWLRTLGRDPYVRLGKFNPGQKLNASFVAGAIVVMLGTGSIMFWNRPFTDDWRTGATFVHDWTAIGLFLAITGHVMLALGDRDALGGMLRGSVPADWARRHRPRWYEELSSSQADERPR